MVHQEDTMAVSATAVLLYENFCLFEISVALSVLSQGKKKFITCSPSGRPLLSEEGIEVVPRCTLFDLDPTSCDSLLLPGASDIRSAIEDPHVLAFVRAFQNKPIGAISIAPLLLVKAGIMGQRRWMAGVNRQELMEEGFSEESVTGMVDWNELQTSPIPEGYLLEDGVLTSVAYHFVPFGVKFGEMVGAMGSIRDYTGSLP